MPPNTTKVLCYFEPDSLPSDPGDGRMAGLIRARIAESLASGLTPKPLSRHAVRRPVDLDNDTVATLARIGQDNRGLSPGRVAGGLLLALSQDPGAVGDVAQSWPTVKTQGLRAAQENAVTLAAPHLMNGRIVLAEAGTGSGKSRMIAHLAAYVLSLRDAGHDFGAVQLQPDEHLAKPYAPNSYAWRAVLRAREKAAERAAQSPLLSPAGAQGAVAAGEPHVARAVVLAAPTVETAMHLVAEYERCAAALDPQGLWTIGVVLGRGQFVSETRILEMLSDQASPDEMVQDWVRAGMPAGSTPTTKALARLYPGICGLADDLRAVATDFPIAEAGLTADSTEAESEWYHALREIAQSCDIVVATHMMLALDNLLLTRTKRTMLPAPLALFIDEAHQYEQAQANAMSLSLSLSHLRSLLRHAEWGSIRCSTVAAKALSDCVEYFALLRDIPDSVQLPVDAKENPTLQRLWLRASMASVAFDESLGALIAACEKNDRKQRLEGPLREMRNARATIAAARQGRPAALAFTPSRRYPLLTVGPTDASGPLAVRWDVTPCAALFSGTLLFPGINGPMAGPTIRRLALPPDRTVAPVHVHPHWIRGTPLMFTPERGTHAELVPPTGERISNETLTPWLASVARVIAHRVAPTAAGGTLVLMTGYERQKLLDEQLRAIGDDELNERLIVQSRQQLTLSQALTLFRKMSSEGKRPILLGTGGAWTGIDLRDGRFDDAHAFEDLLLTDLVMPALPFGMNNTITHTSRVRFAGFAAEKDEALRTFLQGLGRLVRRDGLRHRRIWAIDGRLVSPAHANSTMEFRRIIQDYPSRREFDVPLASAKV